MNVFLSLECSWCLGWWKLLESVGIWSRLKQNALPKSYVRRTKEQGILLLEIRSKCGPHQQLMMDRASWISSSKWFNVLFFCKLKIEALIFFNLEILNFLWNEADIGYEVTWAFSEKIYVNDTFFIVVKILICVKSIPNEVLVAFFSTKWKRQPLCKVVLLTSDLETRTTLITWSLIPT